MRKGCFFVWKTTKKVNAYSVDTVYALVYNTSVKGTHYGRAEKSKRKKREEKPKEKNGQRKVNQKARKKPKEKAKRKAERKKRTENGEQKSDRL